MPNARRLWKELLASISSTKRFLKFILWGALSGSLLIIGVIVVVQLRKEYAFARELQQSRVYVPGENDVSAWLTVEDLALPGVPMPKLNDYYLWRNEMNWGDEEIQHYWSDADLLPLSTIKQRNRAQLRTLLEQVK